MRLTMTVFAAFSFITMPSLGQADEHTQTSTPAIQAELTTLEQKASYTLGVDLAKNLAKQGLKIDARALAMGLDDALQQRPLALTPEEMNTAVMEAKKIMQAEQAAQRKIQAEKNALAGNEFRQKYAEQEGVLVTESGILYKVLQQGEGQSPTPEDNIFTHYEGKFINGKVFDSSYKRGRALRIRASDVIKGWGEILQRMKPGDKWEVVIPPELAYGEKGAGDMIGPNETLIFTIELISFGK
ncbi:FKBP-type peptidyl-prolyl cis-trans isomerase [Thiomicrorhabdus sp. 6S3-12]|uniref:FKBP-type peptidyl-prolyl cis-trans isomerase n=1 Tax=Thiomicrorhabdus sp. 6S3-12 TaxID=2819681 RepID=UPI001AADF6C4|nr:FKBP-type peptidyl-prolyl cis-trans isomerase [Thiomicrorhabdus sp. 6S3-12]MBO1924563.1 FKBP-type peptidyl-prolyl cis-trans isomerase [Thiomicrorhabdus sp. 6S3-12]